jgi:hypothetical protein
MLSRRITPEQKRIITNVCVFDEIPNWFFARRLNLHLLPEDDSEQQILIAGLDALLERTKPSVVSRKPVDTTSGNRVKADLSKSELCL